MILPSRIDLDKAKAKERQLQIDEGLALTKSIEELRNAKLTLEKNFNEYRIRESQSIQEEIARLGRLKDIEAQELENARKIKAELQKPLDEEWAKVNLEKQEITEQRKNIYLETEQVKEAVKDINKKSDLVKKAILKVKTDLSEAENIKKASLELKTQRENELKETKKDRSIYNKEIEIKITSLDDRIKEYDTALTTIELREKQVQEKESELITREKDLQRRIDNFNRSSKL